MRGSLLPLTAPLLCAALVACNGTTPRPEPEVASVATSAVPSRQVALALAASLEPEGGGALPDGILPRRVHRLATQLAEAAGARLNTVTVLASPHLIARALPDGHLQVSRGLLATLAEPGVNQPAVAAVLAYLIGHVQQDPAQRLARDLTRALGRERARLPGRIMPVVRGAEGADRDAPALRAALALARGWDASNTARADRASDLAAVDSETVSAEPSASACQLADRRAAALLARVRISPAELQKAYERLAAVRAVDPEALTPFERCHGGIEVRMASAVDAARAAERIPAEGLLDVQLDLAELKPALSRAGRAEAALLLVRRHQAEAALALLGEENGTPRGAEELRAVAAAQAALGQTAEAERTLRALLLREPGEFAGRLQLAQLYLALDRRFAAAEELHALVRRAPLLPQVHLLLGQATIESDEARLRLELAAALGSTRARQLLEARDRPPPKPRRPETGKRILGGG